MTLPRPLAEPRSTLLGNGMRVRYRVQGEGDPVLLLHGIGCSLEDFDEQVELLSGRYRCWAVDLAGFGGSDPMPVPGTVGRLGAFVAAFTDAVGLDVPAHVVGNSLGGAVALRFTADHPGRVRTLTLADPAGFGRDVTVALRAITVPFLARRLLEPSAESARRTLRAVFHDGDLVTAERVALAERLSRRPHAARVMHETARSLGTPFGVRRRWRRELLRAAAANPVPTLVVWGEQDEILPATHLHAARRALPHARTHLFAATGHMPQIERAGEFADLVQQFWTETTTSRPGENP
ncbi:alpha/beta fold hydrolase [Kineococcus sp. LSe6-4]|uniref:Alpha/beta fold hydrolase n=1 Tax=Kineococcus halophytocola TaxID=3234027 RepID=A0ABV4H416_9ACTN